LDNIKTIGLKESEYKEIINFCSDISHDHLIKEKFECLSNAKAKEVIEQL
jgi:hypothetical protein